MSLMSGNHSVSDGSSMIGGRNIEKNWGKNVGFALLVPPSCLCLVAGLHSYFMPLLSEMHG